MNPPKDYPLERKTQHTQQLERWANNALLFMAGMVLGTLSFGLIMQWLCDRGLL